MQLILLRHAEAADKESGSTDFARVLTPKGRKHAERVGRLLAHRGLRPDLVVTSPAARAAQTAEAACWAMGVPGTLVREDPTLYENDVPDLLDAIRRHAGASQRLMLVGHDPSFSGLARLLSGQDGISLGKGEAAVFSGFSSWDAMGAEPLRVERLDA